METQHFGLADLIKKSAMQICYLRNNPDKAVVTPAQVAGNELALAKATSQFLEMRGTYKLPVNNQEVLIHYAFDEVIPDFKDDNKGLVMTGSFLFIEHKNITSDKPVTDWYVNNSMLQLAVYAAFNQLNPSRYLNTATFFMELGNPKQTLFAPDPLHSFYQLQFNDTKIDIEPIDVEKMRDFYGFKALATSSYERAKEWDAKFKFKEFDYLKDCFEHSDIPWTVETTKTLKCN
jgi:hypothetical protein